MPGDDRWDHSIHYYPILLSALRPNYTKALDIGCGNGMLTRLLRTQASHVIGIDIDPPMIDLARKETGPSSNGIEFVVGDVMTYPFEPESFDAIVSSATLHHLETATALQRMKSLLRPGGTLGIIGLARSRIPQDLLYNVRGIIASRVYKLRRNFWRHPAPIVWPPKDTFAGVERIANAVLPGVCYQRLLLFRYTLTWTKPNP
jgi:SAM-dependent methyltransferase